jgi:glycosyltransferase involved in cell wall biosynthesis
MKPVVAISKYESNGVWKRVYNAVEASFRQGDVNHVTGDVNFLANYLSKNRTILTILDCVAMTNSAGFKRWFYQKFFLDMPVRRAKYVTVISNATKQEVLKYVDYPEERIVIVPVAVSERYYPAPKKINVDKPRLLHVGLAPNKNLDRLIEAIQGMPCHLDIVGKLNEQQKEKLAQHEIEYSYAFNISDDDMVQQYVDCDILTFVSTYEGFGMPIVEANAVGRPVLTSNLSSMPEVAGSAACLVDPFDVTSIRNGLLKIINNEEYRNNLIARGFENCKRFDAQQIAEMYFDLYRKVGD